MIVATILQDARHFADRFLQPQEQEDAVSYAPAGCHRLQSQEQQDTVFYAPSVHHHHHYYHDYWSWRSPQPIYIQSDKKKKEEEEDNALLAVALVIAVLVCSYFIGTDIGKMSNLSEHQRILKDQRELLEDSLEAKSKKAQVFEVLDKEDLMVSKMKFSATGSLMIKSAFLISCAGALAGLSLGSVLFNTAVAGGALSLAATLTHWGYTNADTSLKEEAVRLQCAIHRAEARS